MALRPIAGKPAPTLGVGVGLPAMAISSALRRYLTHIKAPRANPA